MAQKTSIAVNTLVRDGDDFLEICITTILPYVNRVIITIDSRSKDRTLEIVEKLAKNPKVEFSVVDITNPHLDLVRARNSQLKGIEEEFGWIVDSDEYHPFVSRITLGDKSAYGFLAWSPWTSTYAHKATSKNPIGRIFRMKTTLEWRGKFGKEILFDGNKKVFSDVELLPMRYIHFTHWKKDNWREEMNKKRVADSRLLVKMPDNVITYVKELSPLRKKDFQESYRLQ